MHPSAPIRTDSTATNVFQVLPYVGAGPVTFGMTPEQVAALLGAPRRVQKNVLGERDESREGVRVCYSGSGHVVEIGLAPPTTASYKGADLFGIDDPIALLLKDDPEPFESVGFLVFLQLGLTATGLHDDDQAQKAVTVFAPGRWDSARERLRPWKRERV